ncbi:MAG: hypothetical protein M1588_01330 [Planctomycetes bacterium]|nr:hypothetical protein [Planctomycetota bacterium]
MRDALGVFLTKKGKKVAENVVKRLFTYALDPSASDAEACNAASRAVLAARRDGLDVTAMANLLSPPKAVVRVVEPPSPPFRYDFEAELAGQTRMRFGKYKNYTLWDIRQRDPAYLQWLLFLDNLRQPLRSALETFLRVYA